MQTPDQIAEKIHTIATRAALRAAMNSSRFEIGNLTSSSQSGQVSTTFAGRDFERDSVSLASYVPNLSPGDCVLMCGSRISDTNFGVIPSPWVTG